LAQGRTAICTQSRQVQILTILKTNYIVTALPTLQHIKVHNFKTQAVKSCNVGISKYVCLM